jgi:hypothetical protein
MGAGAAEAKYALESLLHDPDEIVRDAARGALDAISPKPAED